MPRKSAPRPEPAGTRVEAMRETDLAQVLEIERAVFPAPWSAEGFRYELSNPRARVLVARSGTEVVGYVCVWLLQCELKINNVAVRDDWRRRGLGARLLETVLQLGRSEGCDEATLEVRASNVVAVSLYRRFGFREVGRRKAYYRDSGEDAVLMTKALTEC